MTDTLITVDVRSAALVQRAKAGQAAGRQAAIDREQAIRQEKEVQRERQRRERAGIDRLSGRRRDEKRRQREEPAAGYAPTPVLCIAVLDENDSFTPEEMQVKWDQFRQKYGKKREIIVLCVSYPGYGENLQSDFVRTYPDVYTDGISFPMPYEQIKRYRVTRNNKFGDTEPEPPTVWQSVARQSLAGKKTILLSVDNSGSMALADVRESYDSFVAWAAARGIKLYDTIIESTVIYEDYVTPFDAEINTLSRIYPP